MSGERVMVGDAEYCLDSLTHSLGFLTRVVQVQINEKLRSAGALAVSPATFSALRLLEENPGIRQVHVARILMIQESNMANLVKELVAQGLIERREEAGRRGGLWLTEDGGALLRASVSADTLDRSYAAALSDKDYRQLLSLLDRIYRAGLSQKA